MSDADDISPSGPGEERMFLEKRPTCVTVIGWAWIVIGGLACLSVIWIVLLTYVVEPGFGAPDALRHGGTAIVWFGLIPLLLLIEAAFGVLGLVAGINFLKLKAWSRKVLLVLS